MTLVIDPQAAPGNCFLATMAEGCILLIYNFSTISKAGKQGEVKRKVKL